MVHFRQQIPPLCLTFVQAPPLTQRGTTKLVTGSCSPLRWCWRSGGIGWRGPLSRSSFGQAPQLPAARWAFVFNRFHFTLSYRPSSKNTKPDALSRLFPVDNPFKDPSPILPASACRFFDTFTELIDHLCTDPLLVILTATCIGLHF